MYTGRGGSSKSKLLYFSTDLKLGYSKAQSEDSTSILPRKMGSYSIEAAAGLRLWNMILSMNVEYAMVKQFTDPNDVENSNTQGTLKLINPVFGIEFGALRLFANIPVSISSEYVLDQKNSLDQEVIYKDAKNIGGQIHLMTGAYSYWGLGYQKISFEKISSGGTEAEPTDATKLNIQTFSILYGFSY